jgi:hypothetical protein
MYSYQSSSRLHMGPQDTDTASTANALSVGSPLRTRAFTTSDASLYNAHAVPAVPAYDDGYDDGYKTMRFGSTPSVSPTKSASFRSIPTPQVTIGYRRCQEL